MIPIAVPCVDECEARAVQRVLESGWLTQGPQVAAFEQKLADACGTKYAVAVSSCTTALHLALLALDIGPGDEVICPSMSFIATANVIRHAGATPIFAEVDERTYNLDPAAVEAAVTQRTRAILVVHQIGLPADMDPFNAIGKTHDVKIVEDAACAIGSRYKGRPIGGHSEMACFSFHPRKVLTTGEGGAITTDNPAYVERLKLLRQHGMGTSDAARHAAKRVLIEEYLCVGFNYRLTDMQAAMGIEQLNKLAGILQRRRALADRYSAAFRDQAWLRPPVVPDYAEPNFQSYAVRIEPSAPMTRTDLMQYLLSQGIATRRGIMLAHREAPYRDQVPPGALPRSERASDESLLLPLYPTMSDAEQDYVIQKLQPAALQAAA
jgi:dTDP-4-amino-4,6-dideoxygalactose transaminase